MQDSSITNIVARDEYGALYRYADDTKTLLGRFVDACGDGGIERTGRRDFWEAVNYDLYGYDDGVIVVQRRYAEKTKYGTNATKRYVIAWAGDDGTINAQWLDKGATPRRLGDDASPRDVVAWAVKKLDLDSVSVQGLEEEDLSARDRLGRLGAVERLRARFATRKAAVA